jgi:hypothetical protein
MTEADSELEPLAAEDEHVGRGFAFLALLALGVGVLIYRLYPSHRTPEKNPNFVDVIFANNLVVLAARLVLLSAAGVLAVAAVFIVISFWKRGKAGHWMSRFGPFETQAVEDLAGQVNQWIEWWQVENARADELQGRVEESEKLFADLYSAFQTAQSELSDLRAEGGISSDQGT